MTTAISLDEVNLAEQERVLDTDHPDVLSTRDNLANAYRNADRLDEAMTLAGRVAADRDRVLATELLVGNKNPMSPSTGPWWSLTPLAGKGALATALADDPATATDRLADALGNHPSTKAFASR